VREAATKLGHRPSLDGLRGISILAVMAFHAGSWVVKGGHLGVDMFFVLSGFLITFLLLQEWDNTGSISLKKFYIRRALRLLPALVTVLLVCGIYAAVFAANDSSTMTYRGILYTLLYSSNWYQAFNGMGTLGPLSHTWSLSIEEQFYILWPPLLVVMLRASNKRRYILGLLLLGITSIALNRARLWNGDESFARAYAGLDTRADAILIGCLAGLLVFWNLLPAIGRRASYILSIGSILFLAYMGLFSSNHDGYMYLGAYTIFAAGVGVVIILLLRSDPKPLKAFLEIPVLVWIGRLSYGLYLWHIPIYTFCYRPDQHYSLIVKLTLEFGLTFVVASLSYYLIEKPFLRLKHGFNVVRTSSEAAAPMTA
jgi:peptidoglycan/LPS O-acetylase OafA/YrhL